MFRLQQSGLITIADGWRIADKLRKTKGLPKCYKHFDTCVNIALEMKNDGVYDEMYPFVTIVGEHIAHGLGVGNNDALGKTCVEELRQTLGSLIEAWKIGGIDTIVYISSVWAFDYHVGNLLRDLCKAAEIDFSWTAVEYGTCKKEDRNGMFIAQGANVVSCLISLTDSEISPMMQIDEFNIRLCGELFR